METKKSRSTKIIAHVSAKVLRSKFPDYNYIKTLRVLDIGGDPEPILVGETTSYAGDTADLIVGLAEKLGYFHYLHEEKKLDRGWISIAGSIYSITEVSERKTAIHFSTENMHEAEHYEQVDRIVQELAKKDIAVLDGKCEITITTRC